MYCLIYLCRYQCGHCEVMAIGHECVCCCEIDSVKEKMEESSSEIHCIIVHEGFQSVCLDVRVLQTTSVIEAAMGTLKKNLFMSKFAHTLLYITSHCTLIFCRRYWYMAYCQLTSWCWGWLRRRVRVVLPSCAVKKIRNTFPSDSSNYTGFKYPHLWFLLCIQ